MIVSQISSFSSFAVAPLSDTKPFTRTMLSKILLGFERPKQISIDSELFSSFITLQVKNMRSPFMVIKNILIRIQLESIKS